MREWNIYSMNLKSTYFSFWENFFRLQWFEKNCYFMIGWWLNLLKVAIICEQKFYYYINLTVSFIIYNRWCSLFMIIKASIALTLKTMNLAKPSIMLVYSNISQMPWKYSKVNIISSNMLGACTILRYPEFQIWLFLGLRSKPTRSIQIDFSKLKILCLSI